MRTSRKGGRARPRRDVPLFSCLFLRRDETSVIRIVRAAINQSRYREILAERERDPSSPEQTAGRNLLLNFFFRCNWDNDGNFCSTTQNSPTRDYRERRCRLKRERDKHHVNNSSLTDQREKDRERNLFPVLLEPEMFPSRFSLFFHGPNFNVHESYTPRRGKIYDSVN